MTVTLNIVGAIAIAAGLVVATKIVLWLLTYKKWMSMFKSLPCDPIDNVIFGNLFQFPGRGEEGLAYQRKFAQRYPKLFNYWVMQMPQVQLIHPDTTKSLLKSSEPKGTIIYELIRPWIGDGLLTSNHGKWARNRKLLTPAFHFEILKNYISVKNECALGLEKRFENVADKPLTLDVFSHVTMFTLDVILRCAMSFTTNCQDVGEIHPYVQAVNGVSTLAVDRFLLPWLYPDFLYFLTPMGWQMKKHCNTVHKVAQEIIQKRKAVIDQVDASKGHRKCMDFLDILLTARDEEGQGLSPQEIRDEVDTFLFEGHDTTASAISWSLYSIAGHPEVQTRLQQELDGRFAGRDHDDVTWEDLSELPYLTCVVKESLRLHTPVPFIQRTLTKDTEYAGHVVPKGAVMAVNIYVAHHNPQVWEDSMKFDPERFTPENNKKRDSYAFIPFSAGPRNCIGQAFAMDEIKLILARLLFKYSIKLDPNHKVEKEQSVVMRAKNDIKIFVSKRH